MTFVKEKIGRGEGDQIKNFYQVNRSQNRASNKSRKKVSFLGIFRDKFAEKWPISREFGEKYKSNFAEKRSLKKANFEEIFWANFARKPLVLR